MRDPHGWQHLPLVVALCLCPLAGCVVVETEAGSPTPTATDTPTLTGTPTEGTPPPPGGARLSFEPTYGSRAKAQFDGLWQASIPGYDARGKIVLLLCETSDPTCREPVLVHEVLDVENTDSGIMQNSWGPDVMVSHLPAGDFKLQVVYDSERSRELGFGWNDDFSTREVDWGGIVSESDMLLADPADHPTLGHNPAAKAWDITLTSGETLALGTIALEHYHQRDISPVARAEDGLLVVATGQGARVIDTATHSVEVSYAFGGTDYYDHTMLDEAGNAVDGQVCGLVEGPDKTVFLLFLNGTKDKAGFAIQFDPVNRVQLNGAHRVWFPGSDQDFPCRGKFHQEGDQSYLWVSNVPSDAGKGAPGFWYVNLAGQSTQDLTAGYLGDTDDPVFRAGVDRIDALGNTLYLGIQSSEAPCAGHACAFAADFDTTGKPTLRKDADGYDLLQGGLLEGDVVGAESYSCVIPAPSMGMKIAPFHDGRNLLFIGTCLEVAVFDLSTGAALDYNGSGPGAPAFSGVYFGQGFSDMVLSPDKKLLWVVPATKSLVHFCFEKGPGGNRQTFNRHMFLPLDLSAGSLPDIAPAFNQADLDGFSGQCGTGSYQTPAIDPGVDLDFAYLKQYVVWWAPDLAGATPTAVPVGPTLAAGQRGLWLRGSGVDGVSGLANQGNLGVFDLEEARAVLWPRGDETFYGVWMGGTDTHWGYDLTPESTLELNTLGLLFLPH